jgi:hypothetical protein
VNDVRNMFETKRDTNEIWCHSALDLLLVWYLLMSRSPGMDDEGFRISNVCEVGTQLQVVDNCCDLFDVARNTL